MNIKFFAEVESFIKMFTQYKATNSSKINTSGIKTKVIGYDFSLFGAIFVSPAKPLNDVNLNLKYFLPVS